MTQEPRPVQDPSPFESTAAGRLQALEALLDDREHNASLDEAQWSQMTSYVVDAGLGSDDATLTAAYRGLQWMSADLARRQDTDQDLSFEGGRVRGVTDVVRWQLRRSVSAAAPVFPQGGLLARMLQLLSAHPGSRNDELAVRLGVDETQISRAGRHLRSSTLAIVRRVGRENAWYVTPRGLACLEQLGGRLDVASSPHDQGRVLTSIMQHDAVGSPEVEASTGLSASSVEAAITSLAVGGSLVHDVQAPAGQFHGLRINEQQHRAIGINIDQQEVVGVLTNLRSEILQESRRSISAANPETVLAAAQEVYLELWDPEGRAPQNLLGAGVDLPGHLDARQGTVIYSPLGPQWSDFPLAAKLRSALGIPVVVENDVNALALHEQYFGAGQGLRHFAVVLVTPDGQGVGSGLVINGELLRGARGSAGELGHTPLGEPEGKCRCSHHGCLESGMRFPGTLADLSASLQSGQSRVEEIPVTMGTHLGKGVATLMCLLNPERVIVAGPAELIDLGGGITSAEWFTSAFKESVEHHAFGNPVHHCHVVPKHLTSTYLAHGAASTLLVNALYAPTENPRGAGARQDLSAPVVPPVSVVMPDCTVS